MVQRTSDRLRVHPVCLLTDSRHLVVIQTGFCIQMSASLLPFALYVFLGVNFIMKFPFCLPPLFSLEVQSHWYTSALPKQKALFEWDWIEIGISEKQKKRGESTSLNPTMKRRRRQSLWIYHKFIFFMWTEKWECFWLSHVMFLHDTCTCDFHIFHNWNVRNHMRKQEFHV